MKSSLLTVFVFAATSVWAQSVYTERPPDLLAVIADHSFGLQSDGVADDTQGLQAAIDRVAATTGQGIVLLPQGRYRITRTLHLWSGVRLIGYGNLRPVLLLAPNTPGYQSGHGFLGTGQYMLQFASRKPAPGQDIVDANEFTFYSGISNVDFEVGDGNAAAICIRFHVAQHSFLSHIHFSVGHGRAALEDVGNQADTLEIDGGDYGIISVRTSPAWQFLLMGSHLIGQRIAAIHTQEVGMTLVRDIIERTPIAVEIPSNMPEQLYGRDLLLRDISHAAVVLGDTTSQHHQITLDMLYCSHVAQLLQATHENVRGFAAIRAPAAYFVEDRLTVGQEITSAGREGDIRERHHERILASEPLPVAMDIPALPPVSEWTNVHTLGVSGDGGTDDTAALQRAIDDHRIIYLPMGVYRVRATLHLKPDTILIGLHPSETEIIFGDADPNLAERGEPVPILESSPGGHEIVTGVGIFSGEKNPRAAGIIWRSGPSSFVQDVNFPAGFRPAPILAPKYQRPAPDERRTDTRGSENPSLWVRENGGGVFRDIWTADTSAVVGLRVENTQTPSIVYQISCEHHMHNEVQFNHASNWTIYALQTEEEMPNGSETTPLELIDSTNLTFANLFDYRVSRNVIPHLAAVESTGSHMIRIANMHNFSMTRLAFDNSIVDRTRTIAVRTHDFAAFLLDDRAKPDPSLPMPKALEAHATLQRLIEAGSFINVSGLTEDGHGHLFFTDAVSHRVLRWDEHNKPAAVVTEAVDSPISLASAGNLTLLAIDANKSVYAISTIDGHAQKLAGESLRTGTTLLLPTGFHNDILSVQRMVGHEGIAYAPRSNMAIMNIVYNEPRSFFYAPDTSTAIMAGGSWKGLLQAVQFSPFKVGESRYGVSEEDDKLYRLTLHSFENLSAEPFIARGGTSVVTDSDGNLYIAGAQVFIYSSLGKFIGTLEVPERPSSLAFGGVDRRTLYIGARKSIYSVRSRVPGN